MSCQCWVWVNPRLLGLGIELVLSRLPEFAYVPATFTSQVQGTTAPIGWDQKEGL